MSTIKVTISPRVRTTTVLRTGATGLPGEVGATGPQGAPGIDGIDGREVQLQKSATHVQWRYEGETAWSNLVALAEITGPQGLKGDTGLQGIEGLPGQDGADGAAGSDGTDGREVELRTNSTHVQWRYVGTASWTDLIALSAITGPQGAKGDTGSTGPAGSDASVTSANITSALGFTPDNPSSSRTPTAHTHPISDVTGLQTALDGKQAAGSYAPATGISPTAIAGTAVITTDSRLSDARTPTSHKSSHATGGSDALTASDIGAASVGQSIAFSIALS